VTLPASAAERRRLLSVDITCPRDAPQQTRRTPLLLSIDGTDGRTHRRADRRVVSNIGAGRILKVGVGTCPSVPYGSGAYGFKDPALHTTRAASTQMYTLRLQRTTASIAFSLRQLIWLFFQYKSPYHPALLATFPLMPLLCLHLLTGTLYLHTFVLSTPHPHLNAT